MMLSLVFKNFGHKFKVRTSVPKLPQVPFNILSHQELRKKIS